MKKFKKVLASVLVAALTVQATSDGIVLANENLSGGGSIDSKVNDVLDVNKDGIDDKYQKDVKLSVKNGTFSDGSIEKTIKVTLYDANGDLSETGTGYIGKEQIPITSDAYADEYYTVKDVRETMWQEIVEIAKWHNLVSNKEIDDLSTYAIQSSGTYSFEFEYVKDTDLYSWGTEHIILDVDGNRITEIGEFIISDYFWKKLGSPQYYTLAEFDLQRWPTGYTTFEPRGEVLWGGWDYSKFEFLGAELNGESFDYANVHAGMKLASGTINYYYQVRSGLLTINYVDEEGNVLAEAYSKKVGLPNQFNEQDWNDYYNGKYEVMSPNIEGYALKDNTQGTIKGVMEDEDGLTINVVYEKIDVPVDPDPTDPEPPTPEEPEPTPTPEPEVPEEPVVPEVPTDPEVPVEPIDPVDPVAPVEPTPAPTPTPVGPVTPVTPVGPDTPVDPVDPADPEDPEVIEDPDTPLDNGEEDIDDGDTPLANLGGWALVNLISMILTVLGGLLLLLSRHKKEVENEESEEVEAIKTRRRWTKVVGTIVGIASVVAFFLTEDMSLKMIMTDKWTILMVVMLLVEIVTLVLGKWWKKEEPEENK